VIECLAQTFLREGGSLEDLKKVWGINYRLGKDRPQLVTLKYNQLESPMGDPLVRQCRGLILDSADNWKIVARPWDKFFNEGEVHAAKIDWPTARVQEKLDGSLIIMYWYEGDWRVATSGTPDASGEVGTANPNYTFQDLFWWLWDQLGCKKPHERWKDWTFHFELLTSYNRIVTKSQGNRIVFISARALDGEEEMVGADEFPINTYHWEAVKDFPLSTMGAVLETFKEMDPLLQEGYVVVDGNLNRIKVKHPGYLALHHLRGNGNLTAKRIIDVVRTGETAEILASFPEWKKDFAPFIDAYAKLVGHLATEYERWKDIPLQKAFALEALKTRCPAALFAMRSQRVQSIRQFLQEMNVETLLIIIEVYKNVA
jgi:hypothetical protein